MTFRDDNPMQPDRIGPERDSDHLFRKFSESLPRRLLKDFNQIIVNDMIA